MTTQERENQLQKLLNIKTIETVDHNTFLQGWKAIAFLHPGLHPDESANSEGGWPDELKPIADEAFRRSGAGLLTDDELYPCQDCRDGADYIIKNYNPAQRGL